MPAIPTKENSQEPGHLPPPEQPAAIAIFDVAHEVASAVDPDQGERFKAAMVAAVFTLAETPRA